jgi:hypothetical protein
MTGRQNARIKSSVGAAFYPCCALSSCRSLGSEGSVCRGSRRESGMSFSRANTLDTGFEPGTSTSEASEVLDRRSLPHDRSTKCADKLEAVSVLPFIHVAHFADLLVAKVQCRGAWGVVGSRGCRFPGRTLWIPVAGFEPGTSTSEASLLSL